MAKSSHDKKDDVQTRLKIASVLCLAFVTVEVIGGVVAHSLTVLSDAAHLCADLAAFLVALAASHFAALPPSTQHTYGLKRVEALAALFSVSSLAALSGLLLVEALVRLYAYVPGSRAEIKEVDGKLMTVIAAVGVCVNVALALVLGVEGHGHAHSHDHAHGEDGAHVEDGKDVEVHHDQHHQHHDHDHHHDHHHHDAEHGEERPQESTPLVAKPKKKRNINLHAAYLHVLGDLAQSIAVLLAGIVIYFFPDWTIVDPICTIIFCVLVVASTRSVFRSSLGILLERIPANLDYHEIRDAIASVPDVTGVHDLHVWSVSDGDVALSVHVSTEGQLMDATRSVAEVCREKFAILHSTIQVQPQGMDCAVCERDADTKKCY